MNRQPTDSSNESPTRSVALQRRTPARRAASAAVLVVVATLVLTAGAGTSSAWAGKAPAAALVAPSALRSSAPSLAALSHISATPATASLRLGESLLGRSRKLRARFVSKASALSLPILRELFGDSATRAAGVYAARTDTAGELFSFITLRPFADKIAGRIGEYRIGFFPSEKRQPRTAAYQNPEGFVEVTADNQGTPLSEHFQLRDFLTHDQVSVWPKYLVLREPLVDKLELVIAELRGMGVPVNRLKVMSGFRTPQYNQQGVGAGGRVQDSRHQFGDAADVYVVNGSRDWMSDLNRDGKVDARDASVIAAAAERVERNHPDLVGGIGIYRATSGHGPFVHIDVRGTRARWGSS